MRRTVRYSLGAAAVIGLGGGVARLTRQSSHQPQWHGFESRRRYLQGRMQGWKYRWEHRQPDERVDGVQLADRVRSELGPMIKILDIPHVHVMAEAHHVLLHGDVADADSADRVEEFVSQIPGVRSVASHLHVGLLPSDSRPSEGRHHPAQSAAMHDLLAAAEDARSEHPRLAAQIVVSSFLDRLPTGEREHVESHLPADVREMLAARRQLGTRRVKARHRADLVAAVSALGGFPLPAAAHITSEVLRALRRHVTDEAAHVAAVLPPDLRDEWLSASA